MRIIKTIIDLIKVLVFMCVPILLSVITHVIADAITGDQFMMIMCILGLLVIIGCQIKMKGE